MTLAPEHQIDAAADAVLVNARLPFREAASPVAEKLRSSDSRAIAEISRFGTEGRAKG